MLTHLSNFLLGAAGRATAMVLDGEARLVLLDHWRLIWPRGPEAPAAAPLRAVSSLG